MLNYGERPKRDTNDEMVSPVSLVKGEPNINVLIEAQVLWQWKTIRLFSTALSFEQREPSLICLWAVLVNSVPKFHPLSPQN